MNNYKEEHYMDSMKKFGTKKDEKVVSDFLTGKPIDKDEVDNIISDAKIEFENLEAAMPVTKVKEPIFFVPMNRFTPINNVLQTAREPYTDAVFASAKIYNRMAMNDRAILTSADAIINQCIDLIISNCYTIFNNGTLLLLKTFYKNNDNFIVDQFINTIQANNLASPITTMGRDITDSLIIYKLKDDQQSFLKAFAATLTEIKTKVSIYLAHKMYDYVRSILLYESIDLDGLAGFFEAESGEKIDYKEDTKLILESAKYSVCVQEMLNIVTDDILRCEEMVEINFVTMFYNLTDLTEDAVKAGVYSKEDLNTHEIPKRTGYLSDRLDVNTD